MKRTKHSFIDSLRFLVLTTMTVHDWFFISTVTIIDVCQSFYGVCILCINIIYWNAYRPPIHTFLGVVVVLNERSFIFPCLNSFRFLCLVCALTLKWWRKVRQKSSVCFYPAWAPGSAGCTWSSHCRLFPERKLAWPHSRPPNTHTHTFFFLHGFQKHTTVIHTPFTHTDTQSCRITCVHKAFTHTHKARADTHTGTYTHTGTCTHAHTHKHVHTAFSWQFTSLWKNIQHNSETKQGSILRFLHFLHFIGQVTFSTRPNTWVLNIHSASVNSWLPERKSEHTHENNQQHDQIESVHTKQKNTEQKQSIYKELWCSLWVYRRQIWENFQFFAYGSFGTVFSKLGGLWRNL